MDADSSETDSQQAAQPDPSVTDALFRDWRSPRFGRANPERLNNSVWEWLIRSEVSAYAASELLEFPREGCAEPGWSFARFGRTATPLADGRVVLIAGEHEDSYDADFYIYNDVVVRHADGALDIYGYPRDVFAPTDFHSATLVGDRIVIIGCLGYPADRKPDVTPVVVVDVNTFSISRAETSGTAPGWIHGHSATLTDDGRAIVISGGKVARGEFNAQELIENPDDWRLHLSTRRWERLTERPWTQWQIGRADRRLNRLWQVQSLWTFRGARWAKEHRESMEAMIREQVEALTKEYGAAPDIELFGTLYRPAIAHEVLPDVVDEHGVHRIAIDGVVVRYVEESHAIKVIVEGSLPTATVASLVHDLRDNLARLENTPYVVRKL